MGGRKIKIASILAMLFLAALLAGFMEPEWYTISQDQEGPHPADVTVWGEAAEYMAKVVWGEARNEDITRQAAVMWCILNRVDDPRFPESIIGVVTEPEQFLGYHLYNPVEPDIYNLALDVISRWLAEKDGYIRMSGRVLPKEYVYFVGRDGVNYYGIDYLPWVGMASYYWDWVLESPYEAVEGIRNHDNDGD